MKNNISFEREKEMDLHYEGEWIAIEEVDKLKPDEKKMVYTFLDAFITKTKLQTLL